MTRPGIDSESHGSYSRHLVGNKFLSSQEDNLICSCLEASWIWHHKLRSLWDTCWKVSSKDTNNQILNAASYCTVSDNNWLHSPKHRATPTFVHWVVTVLQCTSQLPFKGKVQRETLHFLSEALGLIVLLHSDFIRITWNIFHLS